MAADDNKRLVQMIYEALSKGDRSAFAQAVHPEYIWRLAGKSSWSLAFEGQAAVQRDLMAPLFALFADTYTAQAIEIIAEGDIVVAEIRGNVVTKGVSVTTMSIASFFASVTKELSGLPNIVTPT